MFFPSFSLAVKVPPRKGGKEGRKVGRKGRKEGRKGGRKEGRKERKEGRKGGKEGGREGGKEGREGGKEEMLIHGTVCLCKSHTANFDLEELLDLLLYIIKLNGVDFHINTDFHTYIFYTSCGRGI